MAFRSHFLEYWQDFHTHVLLLPDHPYLRLLQSSNTFLDTHMAFRKSPSERTTRLVDICFSFPVARSFCEDQLLFTTFKAILESNFHDYQHYPCNSLFPKAVQIQEMWVGSENNLLLCVISRCLFRISWCVTVEKTFSCFCCFSCEKKTGTSQLCMHPDALLNIASSKDSQAVFRSDEETFFWDRGSWLPLFAPLLCHSYGRPAV